jgi:hypothetical protein
LTSIDLSLASREALPATVLAAATDQPCRYEISVRGGRLYKSTMLSRGLRVRARQSRLNSAFVSGGSQVRMVEDGEPSCHVTPARRLPLACDAGFGP